MSRPRKYRCNWKRRLQIRDNQRRAELRMIAWREARISAAAEQQVDDVIAYLRAHFPQDSNPPIDDDPSNL